VKNISMHGRKPVLKKDRIFFGLIFGLGGVLVCGTIRAVPEKYTLISSQSGDDVSVVRFSVTDFGAAADDGKDDSEAFQQAMDAAARKGGGTVFAPRGIYRFDRPLVIPTGVTLRGEWNRPDPEVRGTILAVYCGRGHNGDHPFITMDFCSGLKHLNIWYPEQDPDAITAYPPTIRQKGGNNATVMKVTLVNSYIGFQLGPENNELHYFKDVYATALKIGMQVDFTTDIGRFENLWFNPSVWENSGLPNAPRTDACRKWMRRNGIGFLFLRSDWPYIFNLNISGYDKGILVKKGSTSTLANGQFYQAHITDCNVAFDAHELSTWGMTLTRSTLSGSQYGIRLNPAYNGMLNLNTCALDGGKAALLSDGNGYISLHQCRIGNSIRINFGQISIVDCNFTFKQRHVVFSEIIESAVILGNRFPDRPDIENRSTSDRIIIEHTPLELKKLPELVYQPEKFRKQSQVRKLYVVTDKRWGIRSGIREDISAKLQRVLDAAAAGGGGIVYIPGGRYVLEKQITVPQEVELRGVYEVPHHSMGAGSVLLIKNRETIPIILKANSGLRGLSFQYPEQEFSSFIPYPYLIQGQGPNIWIIDIDCANPYRYIDLFSYPCDNHFVDYVSGCPLDIGIRVGGGSKNGLVQNCQFNVHSWARCWSCPKKPRGGIHHPEGFRLLSNMLKQSCPFVFGNCRNETIFNNFVYGSFMGIRFIAGNGKGTSGTVFGLGVDGTRYPVYMEKAGESLVFINSQLVSYKSPDNKCYVKFTDTMNTSVDFFNTSFWGGPDCFGEIAGGEAVFHQGSFKRIFPGTTRGMKIDGGTCRLENMHCDEATDMMDIQRVSRPVIAIGNSFYYPLQTDPGKLVVQDGTWRNVRLKSGLRRIFSLGTHPMRHCGVEIITNGIATRLVPVTKRQRPAWMAVEKKYPDRRYVYINVVYDEFTGGTAGRIKLTLDYFDEGIANVDVVYDSADQSVVVEKKTPGAWKKAGTIRLKNSKTWKTHAFIIDDALFNDRCNGHDLRLNVNRPVNFILGAVKIEKM